MNRVMRLYDLKGSEYFEATASCARQLGIDIKKRGRNYQGSCPFHEDKTPSFHLYQKDGQVRFKCFSDKCNGSWDIFSLIQQHEGCSFIEAVKRFGRHVGVDEVILPREVKIIVGR